MPFQSDRQRKAMYAAAEGRSTLGIPQAAAEKFIAHSGGHPKRRKKKHDSPLQRARRKMRGND